jgi:hypothetical protein
MARSPGEATNALDRPLASNAREKIGIGTDSLTVAVR